MIRECQSVVRSRSNGARPDCLVYREQLHTLNASDPESRCGLGSAPRPEPSDVSRETRQASIRFGGSTRLHPALRPSPAVPLQTSQMNIGGVAIILGYRSTLPLDVLRCTTMCTVRPRLRLRLHGPADEPSRQAIGDRNPTMFHVKHGYPTRLVTDLTITASCQKHSPISPAEISKELLKIKASLCGRTQAAGRSELAAPVTPSNRSPSQLGLQQQPPPAMSPPGIPFDVFQVSLTRHSIKPS